jgi:N-methylhydantoinase A
VKRDYVRSRHLHLADGAAAMAAMRELLSELESLGRAWIAREGALLGQPAFVATCDMRYAGQAFDLPVILPEALRLAPDREALAELFHQAHERTYSFRDPDSAVEITTERIRVVGRVPPIALPRLPPGTARPAVRGWRRVRHEGKPIDVPVHDRAGLGAGAALAGPAIVEQDDCTTWIAPGWAGEVDGIGNLVLRAAR